MGGRGQGGGGKLFGKVSYMGKCGRIAKSGGGLGRCAEYYT